MKVGKLISRESVRGCAVGEPAERHCRTTDKMVPDNRHRNDVLFFTVSLPCLHHFCTRMDHKLTFANGKRAVYSTVGGLQPARLVDVGTGLKQKSGPDVNIMPPLQVEVREPSKLSNNVQRYRAIHDTFNRLSLNQRLNTETSTRHLTDSLVRLAESSTVAEKPRVTNHHAD